MRRGACDFIQKPWDNDRLLAAIQKQSESERRKRSELEIAANVQQKLFPRKLRLMRTVDYAGQCLPAREVGGDYYDFLEITDQTLGFVLADVSGKGVPAALLMAFLRASLRAATHIGYAPQISMTKVNYLLWESIERNQFVTAFYGVLDATNRTLSYSNAGHVPALLMNSDGTAHYEERGGVPLGMFRDTRYYEYFQTIEPGQVFLLYTDGVTEAMNSADEEYGRGRLLEAARKCRHLSAREMVDFIHRDLIEWTEGRGAHDDVTFFIIKAR
jgi:sigma-B regulation protein RsbU (phosphoserine phosphatase)